MLLRNGSPQQNQQTETCWRCFSRILIQLCFKNPTLSTFPIQKNCVSICLVAFTHHKKSLVISANHPKYAWEKNKNSWNIVYCLIEWVCLMFGQKKDTVPYVIQCFETLLFPKKCNSAANNPAHVHHLHTFPNFFHLQNGLAKHSSTSCGISAPGSWTLRDAAGIGAERTNCSASQSESSSWCEPIAVTKRPKSLKKTPKRYLWKSQIG